MNFCAYCLTPPCFWEKYWAWESASAAQTSMACSSLRPIRRARSSSFPAAASKYHWPAAFFISGMGNAWLSAPTSNNSLPSASFRHLFITWYALANLFIAALSSATSPEEMISTDPGPKITSTASRLCDFAASASALPASSGEAKVLGAVWADSGCSFLLQAVKESSNRRAIVSGNENDTKLARLRTKSSIAILLGCVSLLLPGLEIPFTICGHHHRHHHAILRHPIRRPRRACPSPARWTTVNPSRHRRNRQSGCPS